MTAAVAERIARRLLALTVALATLASAGAGVARADATSAGAKELFESGRKNYNLGHYDEALANFEKAYQTKDDPAFLFNIAQCQRNLSRYEDASRSYRAYLREGSGIPEATREQVKKLITEMDAAIEAQRARQQQQPTGTEPPTSLGVPPAPAVATAAPAAAVTAEAPPPKPIYKRGWFWGVMAGAVVVVVAVGVGVGVGVSHASANSVPGVTF